MYGLQLLVEHIGGGIGLAFAARVEGINRVVRIAIDNPDKGRSTWKVIGQHHVVVHLADLGLDLNFEYALELDVPALLPLVDCVNSDEYRT